MTTERDTERFNFTWGLPALEKLGFIAVYRFMLEAYAKCGITRTEFLTLVHLASYHYNSPGGESRPSLARVASEMGYSERTTVSKLIASLEGKGMITVERRPGQPSIYNAAPFAARAFAMFLESTTGSVVENNNTTDGTASSVVENNNTSVVENDTRRRRTKEHEGRDSKKKPQTHPDLDRIKHALASMLPVHVHTEYVNPIQFVSRENDTLRLEAPPGTMSWLIRGRPAIDRAARLTLGKRVQIVIEEQAHV